MLAYLYFRSVIEAGWQAGYYSRYWRGRDVVAVVAAEVATQVEAAVARCLAAQVAAMAAAVVVRVSSRVFLAPVVAR